MGNIVQRLTHRGGEFRLTQVNEGPNSSKPQITVTEDSTNLPQDDEIEPNGGYILLLFFIYHIQFVLTIILRV